MGACGLPFVLPDISRTGVEIVQRRVLHPDLPPVGQMAGKAGSTTSATIT